jgi:hypothetical protein
MRAEEIRQHLDADPFVPFRLHLSDGSSYELKHPDQALVTTWSVEIGVPEQHPESRIYHRIAHCSLLHIVNVEKLQAA